MKKQSLSLFDNSMYIFDCEWGEHKDSNVITVGCDEWMACIFIVFGGTGVSVKWVMLVVIGVLLSITLASTPFVFVPLTLVRTVVAYKTITRN